MGTFRNIVCATDFSLSSDYALQYACGLAKAEEGGLTIVHVVDSRPLYAGTLGEVGTPKASLDSVEEAVKEHAEAKMEHVIRATVDRGVPATSTIRTGAPAEQLVELATSAKADLLVVGTRGHSGLEKFILGSVCEKVVRWSPVPVLSVRRPKSEGAHRVNDTIHIGRILCPCDFSQFSQLAVPVAVDLSRRFDATLELAHIVHPITNFTHGFVPNASGKRLEGRSALASLERIAEGLPDVHTELTVRSGTPAEVLSEIANKDEIDMIVMATHGRSGVSHALIGSVAEKLIRLAPCPVLTLRPAESVKDRRLEQLREQGPRPAEA